MVHEGTFKLNLLDVLLVLNFFLDVLVTLEQLVVLGFSQLQSLIKVSLELLFEGIHFVLLLLDERCFGGNNFLVPHLHVGLTLGRLLLLAADLDLVRLLILLLLRERLLDSLLIQKLSAEFEGQRKLVLKILSIGLDLDGMAVFELAESLAVLLLGLEQVLVPLLVELLILLDVSLLAFFALLGLVEDELLESAVIILLLELRNSVFGHLSLNILAFALAGVHMVLQHFNEVLNIVGVRLLVESLILGSVLHVYDDFLFYVVCLAVKSMEVFYYKL